MSRFIRVFLHNQCSDTFTHCSLAIQISSLLMKTR